MKVLLALDTSSNSTGAAVLVDGRVAASSSVRRAYRHSENLISHIEKALQSAGVSREDITGVAVTRGPGSFTGLRVGLAAAKGLSFGLKVPVAGVSSLKALAEPLFGFSGLVAPAVDAKKGQVYAAAFASDGSLALPERAWSPIDFADALERTGLPCLLAGSGADVYGDVFEERLGERYAKAPEVADEIDAAAVARLGYIEFMNGRYGDAAALAASYLRRSEAEEKSFS